MKLYGMSGSGNCYKPALLMSLLGRDYQWIEVDLLSGASHTPEFLRLNANGKVPVLELEPGRCLAESNAMLCYLADGTDLFPASAWERAKVLEWLFFEQYSHEPGIATVRFWVHFQGKGKDWRERIQQTMIRGYAALDVMEQRLGRSLFIACNHFTIADIALYAYTHVADEGGFDLSRYPMIGRWVQRIAAQPGYVSMEQATGLG